MNKSAQEISPRRYTEFNRVQKLNFYINSVFLCVLRGFFILLFIQYFDKLLWGFYGKRKICGAC
jgi:hypothetical protein